MTYLEVGVISVTVIVAIGLIVIALNGWPVV